jgi:Spy/CpxP family protein refolding chaperone
MAVMPPHYMMFENMAETLELTDEQLTQIKDAADKNDAIVQPLMQKAGDACKALREAVMASEYDAAKVQELATAAQKAEAAVTSANINAWTQLRSILSVDQVAKLKEIMSTQRPGPGGPGGPGPMGPPPPAPAQ